MYLFKEKTVNAMNITYWWLVRVTFMVVFGFLLQNFGRWQGATNGTLSIYEWRSSGGNTQTLLYTKEFV